MTDEQKNNYYNALKKKEQPPIIGTAIIKGELKQIEFFDESRLDELNRVRVCYRDNINRRVTSFIEPNFLKKND